jgi:hypothetical protein
MPLIGPEAGTQAFWAFFIKNKNNFKIAIDPACEA